MEMIAMAVPKPCVMQALAPKLSLRPSNKTPREGPAMDPESASLYRRWKLWAVVLGLATLFSFFDAGPTYLGHTVSGRPITWTRTLLYTLSLWLTLGALVGPVLWFAGHFRMDRADQQRWRSLVIHLLAAVGFAFAHLMGTHLVRLVLPLVNPFDFFRSLSIHVMWLFTVDFLIYWAIVGLYYASHYYQVAREGDLYAARLRASLMEARLQALRVQLNPHFLFNTLNAISVLAMKGEQQSVVGMLARLSDLLRVSLDDSQPQEVPLAAELEFIDGYLEIQRIRFSDRLTVHREIAEGTLDVLVPSLILQPIVENAIVHGIGPQIGGGLIRIQAARQNGTLQLSVRDDGPGFQSGQGRLRERIGLTNTRERLTHLYGKGEWMECGVSAEGGGIVTLFIPFNREVKAGERGV
jgi:two-component system, LytTR family, sensor kinase